MPERRLSERQNLSPEQIELHDQTTDLGQEPAGRLWIGREDLEHHRLVRAVLVRAAHEHGEPLVIASDQEHAELHAGEGLLRPDRQIHQVGLAEADTRVPAHLQEVGERAEVAGLSRQAEGLVRRSLLRQVGP